MRCGRVSSCEHYDVLENNKTFGYVNDQGDLGCDLTPSSSCSCTCSYNIYNGKYNSDKKHSHYVVYGLRTVHVQYEKNISLVENKTRLAIEISVFAVWR